MAFQVMLASVGGQDNKDANLTQPCPQLLRDSFAMTAKNTNTA